MPSTIWRGNQLLGDLHIRERSACELVAVLLPVAGVQGLSGTIQWQADLLPTRPVFQEPTEPFHVGESGNRTAGSSNTVRVPSRSLTEAEARGVAPDAQLSIRDEAGRVLSARMITLTEFRLPPGHAEKAFPEVEGLRSSGDSIWMVQALLGADPLSS